MANLLDTKVVTGKVRLSYTHIFEPAAIGDDTEKKYSVSLIIPKSDTKTIDKIKAAIDSAKKNGQSSKFGGKIPNNLKLPLRDGDDDRPEDDAYADCYFVNCTSKTAPGIVDTSRNPILDQNEVYSGCYAIVSMNMFPFNSSGNKGIAAGLNNIMKIADGEPLGGKISAEADFAEVDVSAYLESAKDDDLLG